MKLAYLIERFGVEAICDRPLRGGEVLAILHVERIARAVEERGKAKSVIEWECRNEDDAALLERLEELMPHPKPLS